MYRRHGTHGQPRVSMPRAVGVRHIVTAYRDGAGHIVRSFPFLVSSCGILALISWTTCVELATCSPVAYRARCVDCWGFCYIGTEIGSQGSALRWPYSNSAAPRSYATSSKNCVCWVSACRCCYLSPKNTSKPSPLAARFWRIRHNSAFLLGV